MGDFDDFLIGFQIKTLKETFSETLMILSSPIEFGSSGIPFQWLSIQTPFEIQRDLLPPPERRPPPPERRRPPPLLERRLPPDVLVDLVLLVILLLLLRWNQGLLCQGVP